MQPVFYHDRLRTYGATMVQLTGAIWNTGVSANWIGNPSTCERRWSLSLKRSSPKLSTARTSAPNLSR